MYAGEMDWKFEHTEAIESAQQLKELLFARLDQKDRDRFLSPPLPSELSLEDVGFNPFEVMRAKDLLEQAIAQQQDVVIFGDYDCDGVTATAVIWEALKTRGLVARPFLPHREKHGYGLSLVALEEIFAEKKPDLLITVDNGIVATEAFAWLKKQDVKTILTDHHLANEVLPEADATVHSTLLSGSTVSWFLAHQILPEQSWELLDLAVLGMIADQVPVTGPGRSFAFHGLRALRETQRPSLLALAKIAGVELEKADVSTINFSLAPRINAMGRLRHALDSLRALLSRKPQRIEELMSELQKVNIQRQEKTVAAMEEVKQSLQENDGKGSGIAIVVGEYPEGIIGLLASKVIELTGRPALVGSVRDGVVKFSCRSVAGTDITDFLRSTPLDYLALGGHAMAAGFSLSEKDMEKSIALLRERAAEVILPHLAPPSLSVFAPIKQGVPLREILEVLSLFAPFGAGFPEPRFLLDELRVEDATPLGKEGKHHKLRLESVGTGSYFSAVVFQTEQRVQVPLKDIHSLVVRLEWSRFRPERKNIEVIVESAR